MHFARKKSRSHSLLKYYWVSMHKPWSPSGLSYHISIEKILIFLIAKLRRSNFDSAPPWFHGNGVLFYKFDYSTLILRFYSFQIDPYLLPNHYTDDFLDNKKKETASIFRNVFLVAERSFGEFVTSLTQRDQCCRLAKF